MMLKRLGTLAISVLAFLSCNSAPPKPASTSSVYTLIGDQPVCNVLSFQVLITAMTLKGAPGTTSFAVLPTSAAIKVDFAELEDFTTVMNMTTVPPGTYNQIKLSIAAPQLVIYNPANNPPVQTITPTLSTESPTFALNPPLVVTPGQSAAVKIDYNLGQSVELGSNGQISTSMTPTFSATTLPVSETQLPSAGLDDVFGFVTTVNNTVANSGTNFTGSFVLQLLVNGSGPELTVELNKSSQLLGVEALNQLDTGTFMEVNGYIDSGGNFVANTANAEYRESTESNQVAFLGIVESVTRDQNGNVTQFNFFNRDEQPNTGFTVTLDSTVVVTPSAQTNYAVSFPAANFASFPFGPAAIAPGQQLIVHGTFTPPPTNLPPGTTAPPVQVAANDIVNQLQVHEGNFISLLAAGADNLTGAFLLAPCAGIFQNAAIYVFSDSSTQFINVDGLSSLTPVPSLLVKGLLFYSLQGVSINGVQAPPGSWVLLATQVHQLT
jgi:hypothetical protein